MAFDTGVSDDYISEACIPVTIQGCVYGRTLTCTFTRDGKTDSLDLLGYVQEKGSCAVITCLDGKITEQRVTILIFSDSHRFI